MVSGIFSVIFHPPSLSLGFCLYFWQCLWGCGEGFSSLWVCRGDSIPCGISAAFGNPALSRLTGLFAKQQRNYCPAELLMHPKNSVWTQSDAKNRVRGCTITTSLIFTPKARSFWGRGPGVWSADPALLAHVRYSPLAPVLASLHG